MRFLVEIPEKDAERLYEELGDTIAMQGNLAEIVQDNWDVKKVKVSVIP